MAARRTPQQRRRLDLHHQFQRYRPHRRADAARSFAPGAELAGGPHRRQELRRHRAGFNSVFANKLLVLIDGRTVYSPLTSGVYWDAQDVAMADVERIEIISGPGATIYGVNAVNGVINIITKSAKDSRGGMLEAVASATTKAPRCATAASWPTTPTTAYAKTVTVDDTFTASGANTVTGFQRSQAGFRTDWDFDRSGLTIMKRRLYRALGKRAHPRFTSAVRT
ncbi:TonB-dependent receptor plug domain-containing protein [Massilia sp. B-10]|nr:TonB-dependent receptor plug domain-containing protein [Massilia sp. B-10]